MKNRIKNIRLETVNSEALNAHLSGYKKNQFILALNKTIQ